MTSRRLNQTAPHTNDDLDALLDETETARAVYAGKVDTTVTCQERNSE